MWRPRRELLEPWQVEHVAQALAVGLEHDRELAVALGHLEQRLRLEPLLPEGSALARVGARQQQRPRRVLAEARAEQRRAGQLAHHELLDHVRLDEHELRAGRLVGVGQVDDDAVVRPDRVGLEAVLVADAGAQRERPGGMDAAAERREHAQAPVADLVAEALDHDRAVARHHARGLALLAQVGGEVERGALVEVVLGGELGRVALDGVARELADRPAEVLRPADPVAAPERHGPGRAGGGGHDHPVAGDLLDPPRRRAEQEGLAGARLVDHLLVELAHAAAIRQVNAVEAAVGNRARVRDGELKRPAARADRVLDAVPDDAWAQLRELLGGVAAVEHVEHAVEQLARELRERVGEPDRLVQRGHLQLVARRHHRDHLLGQHVERVARDDRGLDVALAHALRDDRAFEQVGAELGEDAPARHLADAVPGAADALQPRGHRFRRFDLDHEVDRAHVDAEL